ncbi:preprotein translocase subunit SecE [Candidatus Mycoplasma pogonae]
MKAFFNRKKDSNKPKKAKRYPFRLFFLELKRVRWPSYSEAGKWYTKTIIFIAVFVIVFFVITLAATALWTYLGAGLTFNN